MLQAWRWFGPTDPVPLDHIRQAGASTIVSSLHHIPTGEVWSAAEVSRYKALIEGENAVKSPLYWRVVESVNVHDDIKVRAPGCERYVENWAETIRNLGRHGVTIVCYNFMPLIDWTRTDLSFRLPSGATALRFDADRFAAFDLFILERAGAAADYSEAEIARAESCFAAMTDADRSALVSTILAGLPGGTTGSHSVASFRQRLQRYQEIDSERLRENLRLFLEAVLPAAEEVGVRLAIHPDDPPRPMLGLPRVICTAEDVRRLFAAAPSKNNGIALCAGTYGVRPDNDLPAMAREFGERVYFAHLRGTRREADNPLSFHEADHLDSDVDMLGLIDALLDEEARRQNAGEPFEIPVRPDHGHRMLDDLAKEGLNPGYTAIGRLKGLAEIRGAILAMNYTRSRHQEFE
ncbi:MAG: mannonate dehydratase [Pseudomonadota bacterium]